MPLISELLQRLPSVKDMHMSSSGLALWICWEGTLDTSVNQTLQDYGGMSLASMRDQSMWFFFSSDVFLALARLAVWSKFNPLPVAIQVLPGRLILNVRREMSLSLDSSLIRQEILVPQSLQIWVHPKARESAGVLPGITFKPGTQLQGMATQGWEHLEADPRLPYSSSQGWYAILRPLGNPLDKRFQAGWRFMYAGIEEILQRHKFKFILNDNCIMLPLENLRFLRAWVRELLQFFSKVKGASEYWPCVCLVVDRKGLNFNNELPHKVGILWNNLMPDFPYMSYRNAFLLGEGFQITDLHFSSTHSTMEHLCTVGIGEGLLKNDGIIPILMAGHLVLGDKPGCFYCGAKNHDAVECPTRNSKLPSPDIWKHFGTLSINSVNEAFQVIEKTLSGQEGDGYPSLEDEATPQGCLMSAIFSINLPIQLRFVERIWLTSSREFPENGDPLPAGETYREDSQAWVLLERLKKLQERDLLSFEKDLRNAAARSPRDHRLRALLGFVAMERGDVNRALAAWKEAETTTSSGMFQAWYLLLQGRVMEMQARFSEAIDVYQNALRLNSQWQAVEYRQVVCRVKMGFAEQIQPRIFQMIDQDPYIFNRFIIDPELERGHLQILTALYPIWSDSKRQAESEMPKIEDLRRQIDEWFAPDHPVAERLRSKLSELSNHISVSNFIAFKEVSKNRPNIEKEFHTQVLREIDDLKNRFKHYLSVLENIRDEAAWFPFPQVLVEFNRNFNECAGIINWAFSSNFHEAVSFKRAQGYVPTIVELLFKLDKRLKFLRVVRDSTLFILILGRTFFWLEMVGLLLCVIGVPSIAIFGNEIGLGWLRTMIRENHWELQKVLVLILSIMALGIAALRTTLIFEKRRDQLVADAKEQREQMQRARLDRIKEEARIKEEQRLARLHGITGLAEKK